MSKRKDYSGSKFNYLTLMSFLQYNKGLGGSVWKVLCDCGNIRELLAKDVASGKVKSCGKCKYHSKLMSQSRGGIQSVGRGEQELFRRYLRKALKESTKWALSIVELRGLISKSCDFCGIKESVKLKGSKLRYNYIERLESTKGYLVSNCITVCADCKRAKGPLIPQQFINLITRIFSHLSNNK